MGRIPKRRRRQLSLLERQPSWRDLPDKTCQQVRQSLARLFIEKVSSVVPSLSVKEKPHGSQ